MPRRCGLPHRRRARRAAGSLIPRIGPPMEGHLERDGHRTWYRVVGDLDPAASRAPVVICHGGPGATHDYVAPIASQLVGSGRACVLYDQLGNGRSDHLPDADPSFWTVELLERELAGLVEHLGIDRRYHVLGQSWGGMLALLHALERPPGLVSVVAPTRRRRLAPSSPAPTSSSRRASRPTSSRRSAPASAAGRRRRPSSRPRSRSSTSATSAVWTHGPTRSCGPSPRWRATRRSTRP